MWFRKKKSQPPLTEDTNISITPNPMTSRVEVEVDKNANKEVKEKASEINTHVNDLLVQNGFTLKIYLAAGGQLHHKKAGGKT